MYDGFLKIKFKFQIKKCKNIEYDGFFEIIFKF